MIKLSAAKVWKKFSPMLINVAITDNNNNKNRMINEKIFIASGVRIFSAEKMIPKPRWMEVKIERPAQSRLIRLKIPMAVVFTFRRPILTRRSLSRFSLILFRKAKKLTDTSGKEIR